MTDALGCPTFETGNPSIRDNALWTRDFAGRETLRAGVINPAAKGPFQKAGLA